MTILNSFPSLLPLDIFANLVTYIGQNLTIKPKNYVLGFAEKVLQKITQTDSYTPDLPILSCIPGDIEPDESHFAWHKPGIESVQRRFSHCVLSTDDFKVMILPYLYKFTCDIQYTGQSHADIVNARILVEELFSTRHVNEIVMTSALVFPNGLVENLLTPQQLETFEQFIPKELIKLINEERYVIPYPFRYFVRLNGQSDNSSLFGENKLLPDYMCSYNFEVQVSLPTKIFLQFRSKIHQINLNYQLDSSTKQAETTENESEKPEIIEFTELDIDQETGSYIVKHIIKAEEQ